MKIESNEEELAIVIRRNSKTATIHITGNPSFKYFNKLEKLSEEFPDTYKLTSEDIDKDTSEAYYRCYEAPKTCAIGLRKPKTVSEEFKQAASDRFKKMWINKKNQYDSGDNEED